MTHNAVDTYYRARRLANLAVWTIHLQYRRINSDEPEDEEFIFRRFADFDFFVVALSRLRKAVILASQVNAVAMTLRDAVQRFDEALPCLQTIRNVAEHMDDYALKKGRDKSISENTLEVGSKFGKKWTKCGQEIDIDTAVEASDKLFAEIKSVESAFREHRAQERESRECDG